MKAKNLTIVLSVAILFLSETVSPQANTALSNLVAPTAVNQDLLPTPSNARNLGGGSNNWKNIYMGTSYYLKNLRIIHSPIATNFFVGPNAGTVAVTGTNNSALGESVLSLLTSGSFNTGIGFTALRSATSGSRNTALGNVALYTNTTGNYNTASGNAALFFNTTGSYNTVVGNEGLYNNTSGSYGVAIGTGALRSATTTGYQVAIGGNALYHLNGGAGGNIAAGYNAMYSTTTGYYNTAVGSGSMEDNTTGPLNTAVGHEAMSYNTTGRENISIGAQTMTNNNGSYNTVLGVYAGWNSSSNSVFVGWNAHAPVNTINSIAIGYNAAVTANNQVRIGNASVTSIGGPVGWSVVSDGRFKKEVKEDVPGLSFINQLRAVTYNFDPAAFNNAIEVASARRTVQDEPGISAEERNAIAEKSKIVYTGFIAQEVEAVAKKI
jgi:trimeric autotransporter adhesin